MDLAIGSIGWSRWLLSIATRWQWSFGTRARPKNASWKHEDMTDLRWVMHNCHYQGNAGALVVGTVGEAPNKGAFRKFETNMDWLVTRLTVKDSKESNHFGFSFAIFLTSWENAKLGVASMEWENYTPVWSFGVSASGWSIGALSAGGLHCSRNAGTNEIQLSQFCPLFHFKDWFSYKNHRPCTSEFVLAILRKVLGLQWEFITLIHHLTALKTLRPLHLS